MKTIEQIRLFILLYFVFYAQNSMEVALSQYNFGCMGMLSITSRWPAQG
jgi:hypothetical protein